MIGPNEWLLIILAVLVLFGASAIPKFARSLGKAKSEFEKGLKEGKESSGPERAPEAAPKDEAKE
jgi:sec-independent protein translocase protein TatA